MSQVRILYLALRKKNMNTKRKNIIVRISIGIFIFAFCIISNFSTTKANTPGLGSVAIASDQKDASDIALDIEKMAKTDHVSLLKYCIDNYNKQYSHYTCTFLKQETIRGKLGKEQATTIKFMEKPFSVVMTWTENRPSPADRVIFVDGKYNNKILCRPVGLLGLAGTQIRDPLSEEAKASSINPITEFGITKMTQNLIGVYELAKKNGDLTEEFGGYFTLDGRKCIMIIRLIKESSSQNYPANKTETYIDLEYLVPVCVKGWNWKNKLSCTYHYKNLKFDTDLTEIDFSTQKNDMKPVN